MGDSGKTLFGLLLGGGGYWLLRYSGVPIGALAITLAWAVGIIAVGWLAGRMCANALNCDSMAVQAINWSQLVTWLFPPLGLFLSMVTYQMADGSISHEWKFRALSMVGGLAASLNAGIGMLLAVRPAVA